MSYRALLTKREVAPLIGRSERWIDLHAAQFVTQAADRKARNGRAPTLIHVSSLPPEAQRAWAVKQGEKVVELMPAATSAPGQLALALTVPTGPNLSPEDRAEAERRYTVIEPLVAPEKYAALWLSHANRKLALVEWLAGQHKTAARTIYHWMQAWKAGGLPALVTRDRADKGRPRVFNQAALDFILAAALPRAGSYGALSVREIHRAYEEERAWRASHAAARLGEFELRKYTRYLDGSGKLRPEAQLPGAAYETFRTWFAKIPEVVRVMAREGEEAFSNTQEIVSFRDLASINPLDYVVMDHRRLDLFCLVRAGHGKGWKLARPWLTAAIDMRTRRWLGWVIVETPSSDSIASTLKRTFLDAGIPSALYWDNGKDFRCEWLEGKQHRAGEAYRVRELDTATRGVMETLGVRVHHAIVRRARSKIIEPNFGATANFDRTLPEWCGHNAQARPERLEKMIEQHARWEKGEVETTPFRTIEEIAEIYNEAIGTLNEREHTGEGMQKITATGRGWMCPNEAWELLIRGIEVRRAPAEVIQFCFHKRRVLTVQHCEVRPTFGGKAYHYRFADNPNAMIAWNGREVEFAYDPHDLETAALYADGRFLGLVSNVELRRMGEQDFVQDERDRRASRRDVKKVIAAVHQAIPVAGPAERAARRMAVRPARAVAAQAEACATVAPEIAAAVAAAKEEREFKFADVAASIPARPEDCGTGDDEFEFFAGGN